MLPHFLEIRVGSRYFTFFYSVIMLYFLSPAVVPIRSEMKEVNTYPHMQAQAHTHAKLKYGKQWSHEQEYKISCRKGAGFREL